MAEQEYKVPVTGKYKEKVTIQTVDGPTTAIIEVSIDHVSIIAPNRESAREMAVSVMRELRRTKKITADFHIHFPQG